LDLSSTNIIDFHLTYVEFNTSDKDYGHMARHGDLISHYWPVESSLVRKMTLS